MDWDKICFVTGNRIRFRSLLSLKEGPRTATQISKITGFSVSHISVALKLLNSNDLVRLQEGSDRKNKYYVLTQRGRSLISQLHSITELP